MSNRWLVVLSILLACAGCVIHGGEAGRPAPTAIFSQIVPGKTTRNEVRAMLGAPTRAHQYRAEPGETWEYPYFDGYMEERIFWVEFQPDGKTVGRTYDTKDFYAYPYRGR